MKWFFLVITLWWLADCLSPHDDTDPPGGRSELTLRTDAKTGCEYLATFFGGITPRLDVSGKQIGCRQ